MWAVGMVMKVEAEAGGEGGRAACGAGQTMRVIASETPVLERQGATGVDISGADKSIVVESPDAL